MKEEGSEEDLHDISYLMHDMIICICEIVQCNCTNQCKTNRMSRSGNTEDEKIDEG